MSYFGIATSLIIYLTAVIHLDVKTSAQAVNQWAGVTTLMPLVGGFLADAYFGRFLTVLLSSIVYLMVFPDYWFHHNITILFSPFSHLRSNNK